MKTLFLLTLLLLSTICYSQDTANSKLNIDSIKTIGAIEYITLIQVQIKQAGEKLLRGDGIGIEKNTSWLELIFLMLEDLKKRGKIR